MSSFVALPPPTLRRRLLWVLRFRDVYTQAVIEAPLTVRVPELGLTAVRGATEPTWRLLFAPSQPATMPYPPRRAPADPVPVVPTTTVEVLDPVGRYVAHDPVTIPRAHTGLIQGAPIRGDDFIRDVPLWSTRLLSPPPGETFVVGRIIDGAGLPRPGLRIAVAPAPPTPATPRAVSDAAGEFVIRLPGVRRTAPADATADLHVAVTTAGGAAVALAAVTPAGAPASRVRLVIGQSTRITLTTA